MRSDDIIRGILGEAKPDVKTPEKPEEKEPVKAPVKPKEPAANGSSAGGAQPPLEAEIDELANLWTQGSRQDVMERFIGMDNETAVKLVFAIGREGALEMAKMADEMLEQEIPGGPAGPEGPGAESGLPAESEPAEDDGYPAKQILGDLPK